MSARATRTEVALIAERNDLLQLDRDAVQAYTLAIAALADASLREALTGFRADHEKHPPKVAEVLRRSARDEERHPGVARLPGFDAWRAPQTSVRFRQAA